MNYTTHVGVMRSFHALIAQLNLICKNIVHNCGVLALDLDPSGFDGHIGSE
jgi:hypothetical protein